MAFFDWDDEENTDQDTGKSFDAPEAPAVAAPEAAPAAPTEGVNDDDAELAESTQDQAANDEYAQASGASKDRTSELKQEGEKKKVGAIAARELAWGLAQRAVEHLRGDDPDVIAIKKAITDRTHSPIGIAQDLRKLASTFQGADSAPLVDQLHNAADKLITAAKQESEAGEIPRGILPLTSSEAGAKKADVEKRIQSANANLSTAGILGSPGLRKEIADLENTHAQLSRTESTLSPEQKPEPAQPSLQADIRAHFKTAPGGYATFINGAEDATKAINKFGVGLSPQNLLEQVPLDSALAATLKMVDPEDQSGFRRFLATMGGPASQQAPQQQGGGGGGNPADDPDLQAIRMKQQRYQQVLNELGKKPEAQNWLCAIGMFLTAMVVGPRAAIMIWGRASNENSLRIQLHAMHEDITQSIAMRQHDQQNQMRERSQAARFSQQDSMEGKRETAALTRLFIEHQLILKRAQATHGMKDQDAKDLGDEFNRNMRLAGQALHVATDPNQMDQNKKDAAMAEYKKHQDKAGAINKLLQVPESKVKGYLERKNGTGSNTVSAPAAGP